MAPPAPAGPATISMWRCNWCFVVFWKLKKWVVSNLFLVYLRAVGGESASPAALAPKVGPLGMVSHVEMVFKHVGSQEGWWWYSKGYYGLEGS